MGLEMIGVMFAIEERFGIKFPLQSVGANATVADVAAVVLDQLPRTRSEACAGARTFYALRRAILEATGAARGRVRPGTRLEELLPPARRPWARRAAWGRIAAVDRRIPWLSLSPMLDRLALSLVATLLFVGLMAAAVICGSLGAWRGAGLSALALAAGAGVYWLITAPLRVSLPAGIETVRDLVELVASVEVPATSKGRRLVVQERVLNEVRKIIADETGLRLEDVRPESLLVRDLRMG